jgi:hypothetical protein
MLLVLVVSFVLDQSFDHHVPMRLLGRQLDLQFAAVRFAALIVFSLSAFLA